MDETAASLVVGAIAGISAYYVYPATGMYSSLIVGIGVAWLLFGLTGPSRILKMLRFMLNPPMTGLIAFFTAFIYFSIKGLQFRETFAASFGIALLGGLLGFLFFKYWNLGA